MMNRIAQDEIIPKVEEFLKVLSKEKLSKHVEELRKKLIEEIEIAKLPPTLPPRPEGLQTLEINDNDYIAKQREQSRLKNSANANLHINLVKDTHELEFAPCEVYEDVTEIAEREKQKDETPRSPDVYEVPQNTGHCYQSDSGSGTSYESYNEFTDTDEDMGDDTNTSTRHHIKSDQVKLPNDENLYCNVSDAAQVTSRLKKEPTRKKKKKKKEMPISSLENITYSGELQQRAGLLQTLCKRFCVISDNRLVVYKAETDLRPTLLLPLQGYEVSYLDKDGKNMFRLAHSGCDTQWLFAENKQTANIWLQYLTAACAGTAPPSSGDSGYLTDMTNVPSRDSTLSSQSNFTIMTSSAEVGQSSSEGGSGDGIVQGPAAQQSSDTPDGKNKDAATSKNVLSSLGSLLKSTIGRKKGEKALNVLESMEFEDDPEAIYSGYVNVMSEVFFTGNKKWHKCFCHIKNNTLECFKDRGSESHDICMALNGVQIETGGLSGKHELAFKLVQDDVVKMFFEPYNRVDQGNWLSYLIKETGCASPPTKVQDDQQGDVYNEVQITPPAFGKCREDNNKSDSPRGTPPPLPKNPPPVRTPPSVKRVFDDTTLESHEDQPEYDDVLMEKEPEADTSLYKNVEVFEQNTAKNPMRNIQLTDSGYADSSMDNLRQVQDFEDQVPENMYDDVDMKPKRQVGEIISRLKTKLEAEATTPKYITAVSELSDNPGVVKCQTGPTIAEDKELLLSTQNPLLTELRKGKARKDWGNDELEKLKDQIYDMKKNILQMRRQRTEIRSKKLRCRSPDSKEQFEQQLQDLDRKMEEADKELTKLQVVAQEHPSNASKTRSPASRSSSFNSGTSSNSGSRNSSFRTKKNDSTNGTSSSLVNALVSPRESLSKRASTSVSSPISNGTKNTASRNSKNDSDLLWKKTATSKASTLPANTSPVTSKVSGSTTPPRRGSVPGNKGNNNWRNDRSKLKETTKSTDSSTTNTRSRTSNIVSGNDKKFTARAKPELTSRLNQSSSSNTRQRTSTVQTGEKKMINPPRVQDKLKLWEAKVADSNC